MSFHPEPKMYNLDGVWVTRKQIMDMIDNELQPIGYVGELAIYGKAYDGNILYIFNNCMVKCDMNGNIYYKRKAYKEREILWIK